MNAIIKTNWQRYALIALFCGILLVLMTVSSSILPVSGQTSNEEDGWVEGSDLLPENANQLESSDLFIETNSQLLERTAGEMFHRARLLAINFQALGAADPSQLDDKVAQRLRLNLFPDATYIAVLDYTEVNMSGSYTWVGHIEESPLSSVVLVVRDDILVGEVRVPEYGQLFTISPLNEPQHLVQDMDHAAFPPEVEPDHDHEHRSVTYTPEELAEAAANPMSDNGSVIDVLVVYTTAARSSAGSAAAMVSQIEAAIATTNLSYSNSNIAQRLRLVPTFEVNYTETGDLGIDLPRLKNGTNNLGIAHTLRNAYAADAVLLITATGNGCGIAYFMDEVAASMASWAFGVVRLDCFAGLTLPHELGHIMGAQHDWFADPGVQPYTYSHGFVRIGANLGASWRTVMSYNNRCAANFNGGTCQRIIYWSNPAIQFNGVATGVPGGTSTACQANVNPTTECDANNRLTLNNTALTVSNFRPGNLANAYVDPNGSANGSGSSGSPVNLVTAGAYRAAANGTVWIKPGTYPETVVINNAGNVVINRPMTLRVNGTGTVTIGGQ